MKPIAAIILNWNGEKLLREFLPSVIAHTPADIADVIVVDNGSSDDSLSVMRNEFPSVKLIEFPENLGFAEGYNQALKATSYEYTVLLNSDVAVDDDWLTPMYDYMASHKNVGACQPKILSYADKSKFEYAGAAGGYLDRNGYPYCRGRIFDSIETDSGQYDDITSIFWASGAAFMVRTELYLKAGGLDASFFAHMEEIDLCWRIRLMGYDIVAVPQAHVYHLGGGSLPASNPRKTYLNFRNNLLMLHKNLPDATRRGKLFRRRILDGIAWLKYAVTFDFANAAAIWKAHRDFAAMRSNYTLHPDTDLLSAVPNRDVNILTAYFISNIKTYSRLH